MTQKTITTPLSGRCALITGGAHRIGAQIARTLHREGMNLVLHYRNSIQAAERLKAELETKRPGSVALAQADLHETADLPLLIEVAKTLFGRLDLLVNNASSFYPTPLETATETDWDDLIGSNLKAPFFLSRAAAPLLKVSDGCIVNLVDIHAERPLKAHPIYSIAKAGNAMLVKSLARELGPEIRVNGIAPGAILWPEQGLDAEEKELILNRTALKRPGSPEDIAQTLLFLVRDARYITGQIIPVDGGRTLQQ
ncbi:pteridine reductase [endosymbiont of Lamellibrachia barhami]|uniref:pteridine reductase n=1 Tax=endosymbiont of Lamellibrachia barhami TaxID=205975 RepID=UPI0034E24935